MRHVYEKFKKQMNVIAAVSDDSVIGEETDDALMEDDNSEDNDLKKDAEKTDKIKSDDPKDDVIGDGPSADEENKLTVTSYTGTYDGNEHGITVKASKSGTTFEYSLDNKTWVKEAPRFKDANGTQTVYIKAENGDDTIYDNGTVTINPVKGEGLKKVVVSGSQTEVGSSKNQITDYSFKSNTKAQNYDITLKAGTLTVKKSKTPAKKEEKKEPKKESKLNNTTNKTNNTNTTVIPLQNTGIPVLVLAFSLFVIATLVKRD